MGAVGLTFVTVAAFLGFIVKRGEPAEANRPLVESVLPADVDARDAAPLAAGPASAEPLVDAGPPSDASGTDDDPADAAPAPAVASASPAPSKKAPAKAKLKPPQRWRPKHR
jgi:hypothetical protein